MVGTSNEGRKLGWLSAGVLTIVFMLSSSAWALNVEQEILRQEAESAQILNTLGRDRQKHPGAKFHKDSDDEVKVQLLPARRQAKKSS